MSATLDRVRHHGILASPRLLPFRAGKTKFPQGTTRVLREAYQEVFVVYKANGFRRLTGFQIRILQRHFFV